MGNRGRLFITESKWRTALVIFGVLAIQHKLLWELPLFEIGLPGNMPVYIMRTISALSSILLIWIFVPDAMERVKVKVSWRSLFTVVAIFAGYFALGYFKLIGENLPFWVIIEGGIFAWFIGLDEELFGRGLIFGLL